LGLAKEFAAPTPRIMVANCSPDAPEATNTSAETGPKRRTEENTPGKLSVGRFQMMVGPSAENTMRKSILMSTTKMPT
jgi:hypothetical protein